MLVFAYIATFRNNKNQKFQHYNLLRIHFHHGCILFRHVESIQHRSLQTWKDQSRRLRFTSISPRKSFIHLYFHKRLRIIPYLCTIKSRNLDLYGGNFGHSTHFNEQRHIQECDQAKNGCALNILVTYFYWNRIGFGSSY